MAATVVRLAGYQGKGSILTAALQQLTQSLHDSDWGLPVACQADVTADQEKAAELFDSVEHGQRQIGYMASGYLSGRVSELAVLDLPFSVADRQAALAALDGRAGELLTHSVSQKSGFQVLAFWDNGFRHISNAVRPIRNPQDCQGLVIRTLDSASYRASLAALGFEPVTTDVKDLVRVVQSGQVQAQENPLTNLLNFSLWQHHPYVSLTQHYFGVLLLVCSRAWYDTLSQAQRHTLLQAVALTTRAQRLSAQAQDVIALAQLQAHGVQVLQPHELDLVALRRATHAVAERQRQALPAELLAAYLPACIS